MDRKRRHRHRHQRCPPPRSRSTFTSGCIPQGIQILLHFSSQTLGSQPAPWPTFSRLSPLSSPHASLTLRCCTPLGRSMELSQKKIASWSLFSTSLERTHWRPGSKSSRCASSCIVSSANNALRSFHARFSRATPLVCWRVGPWPLPTLTSVAAHSLSCAFWIRLQLAGVRLEQGCDGSVRFFWHVTPHTSHDFVSDFLLPVCGEAGFFF